VEESNKREIENVIGKLKEVTRELQSEIARLERIIGTTEILTPPKDIARPLLLCWLIKKEGGVVSREKFHELGRKVGYDPRGLGGLFVANSWLVGIADNKVALAQGTEKELEKYREWLEHQENAVH